MRVALVATSYPHAEGDPSGHFVRAEAHALEAQGHEVHIVAPSPVREANVVAHPAGGSSLFSWPGAAARARRNPLLLAGAASFYRGSVAALDSIQPQRVIAHWMVPSAWPIVSATRTRCEVEIVCHGADVRLLLTLPRELRAHIVRSLLARGAHTRFVASSLRDDLLSGLDNTLAAQLERASVVAPPFVSVSPRSAPNHDGHPFVLTAARLIPSKRVDLAIDAVVRSDSIRLMVVGDGPERARLERAADRVSGGRVRFLGALSRPETLGWIAAASALVHLSEVDNAPTVVLEARALDTRVIAADVGAVSDWAKQDSGIVVVPRVATAVSAASQSALL
ncbi:MAG: glycosyltransferase family 4 protein [Polyangiaceae bacterium]